MKNNESPEPTREEIIEKIKKRADVTIRKTWKPTVAGIIDIIMGICGLWGSLCLSALFIACSRYSGSTWSEDLFYWLITVSLLAGGLLAIVGGIYALKREKWVWALIGSICTAIVSVGTRLIYSSDALRDEVAVYAAIGVSILPIVLTLLSKNEFE